MEKSILRHYQKKVLRMKRIILNDKIINFTENPSLRFVSAHIKNRRGRDVTSGEPHGATIEAIDPESLLPKVTSILKGCKSENDTLKTIPDPMIRESKYWN